MHLNYRQLGEGPETLIILHGLFGSLDNWVSIGNRLAEQYRVFLVDLRNHGRSPHAADHTYDAMAEDLGDFFHQHQIEGATLIGHSMGGKVAMTFAHGHAHLLKRMVVIDIGPRAYPVHHDLIIRALQSVDLTALTTRKEAEDELARLIDGNDTLQFLLKNLYREKMPDGSTRFSWRFNLEVIADEIQEVGIPQPWRCDVPTLFIRGSRSDYIRNSDFTAIEKLYPKARFVTLDTGHWVHAENPEGVIEALQAFLK